MRSSWAIALFVISTGAFADVAVLTRNGIINFDSAYLELSASQRNCLEKLLDSDQHRLAIGPIPNEVTVRSIQILSDDTEKVAIQINYNKRESMAPSNPRVHEVKGTAFTCYKK
jgi:hypothetical protein